eukprot:TRINITY_DN4032_c1_g2_i1.p1 TRINITY_DN4032_c1_g2~~TRINITY_DN4032_c1_g2_i1.p1  ORF type:complete len:175 (+),score=37.75 TRINITY_DN4032_c1_g2_i1:62-526(+)
MSTIAEIASVLTQVARIGDKLEAENPSPVSYYHGMSASETPIIRIIKHWLDTSLAPSVTVSMAAIYIERAMKKGLVVSSITVHRVVLSALLVATKFHCDCHDLATNGYYASGFHLKLAELNRLEVKFLNDIEWETFVSAEELATFNEEVLEGRC